MPILPCGWNARWGHANTPSSASSFHQPEDWADASLALTAKKLAASQQCSLHKCGLRSVRPRGYARWGWPPQPSCAEATTSWSAFALANSLVRRAAGWLAGWLTYMRLASADDTNDASARQSARKNSPPRPAPPPPFSALLPFMRSVVHARRPKMQPFLFAIRRTNSTSPSSFLFLLVGPVRW